MTAILSMGRDHSLMTIRTMVLQQAGYAVTDAYSSSEALEHLRAAEFDLMLICHTVPEVEQRELVAAVRLLQPGLQIVYINSSGHQSTYADCATVDSVAPAFLIDLSVVLSKSGSRPSS